MQTNLRQIHAEERLVRVEPQPFRLNKLHSVAVLLRYAHGMRNFSLALGVLLLSSLVLVGFNRQAAQTRWEYKTEVFTLIDLDFEPDPAIVKEERVEGKLNREYLSKLSLLGSQGWELVSLTPVAIAHEFSTKQDAAAGQPLRSRMGWYRATFKRPRS